MSTLSSKQDGILRLSDVKRFETLRSNPSVTVIVPTHRTMPDRQQDPIAVKNALKEAADKLMFRFDERDATPLVLALDALAQKIDFSQVLDSLIFLVNKEMAQVYYVPFDLNARVTVDDRFDLFEVIRSFRKASPYYILVLSGSNARLFYALYNAIFEQDETVEKNQKEIGFPFSWHYDVTSDRELLAVGRGDLDAQYLINQRKEYMRDIDDRLGLFLQSQRIPVVLLGTTENVALFKDVSKYGSLIVGTAFGDYTGSSSYDVLHHARPVIDAYFAEEQKAALALLDEATSKKLSAFGIQDVWTAAYGGQVSILLLDADADVHADTHLDRPWQAVIGQNRDGSSHIIDHLVDLVYEKGGKVVFLAPGSLANAGHVAAILRYS